MQKIGTICQSDALCAIALMIPQAGNISMSPDEDIAGSHGIDDDTGRVVVKRACKH